MLFSQFSFVVLVFADAAGMKTISWLSKIVFDGKITYSFLFQMQASYSQFLLVFTVIHGAGIRNSSV